MAGAADYPVYFPYGATSSPYSASSPHRGDDRCNVLGVPVIIGNTQIGLVGATGKVYDAFGNKGTPGAAHLHIQEWSGGYSNTRKPQNSFQPGTVVNVDRDGTQGDGSFGKFITIQTTDGWNDSYCHLSQINVSVGDTIGVEMDKANLNTQRIAESEIRGGDFDFIHSGKFDKELQAAYSDTEPNTLIYEAFIASNAADYRYNKVVWRDFYNKYKDTAPTMELTIKNQTAQIKTLTDQNAELQKKLDAATGGDAIVITRKGFGAAFDFLKQWFGKNN